MKELGYKALLVIFLLILFTSQSFTQLSIRDSSIQFVTMQIAYKAGFPAGDLDDRFGYLSQLGLDVGMKFKSNFYINLGGHVFFGDQVNDTSIIDHLQTQDLIIADNGTLTDVRLLATGFVIPLTFGKIFPMGRNPNSGLYAEIGAQYIQHKIGINQTEEKASPIDGIYKKGYDRLVSGGGAVESIGYRYFANNGLANFAIGVYAQQNLTTSRRTINFDTGLQETGTRLDLLFGFHFSWIYPLYERAPNKVYFD